MERSRGLRGLDVPVLWRQCPAGFQHSENTWGLTLHHHQRAYFPSSDTRVFPQPRTSQPPRLMFILRLSCQVVGILTPGRGEGPSFKIDLSGKEIRKVANAFPPTPAFSSSSTLTAQLCPALFQTAAKSTRIPPA